MADEGQYISEDERYGALLGNLLNPPDEHQAEGASMPTMEPRKAPIPGVRPAVPAPATPNAVTPSGNGPAQPKTWADYVRTANDRSLKTLDQAQQTATALQNQPSATTENAPLEAQRSTLAQPLDPNAPNYKPGIGSRIARGIAAARKGGIAGIIDPTSVDATPYGAPNRQFGIDTARRTAQVGAIDRQEAQNIANEKADSDRLKGLGTEQRAQATGYQDVAKQATAQQGAEEKGTSANATMLTNMGKAGLKPQFDGQGNIIGVEDDPNSEAFKGRQVMNDLRTAQTEAAQANAELKKAQNDPNSPAFKLAQERAATANRNANAATERAQAYMLNATAGNLGTTPSGQQIEGSVTTATGAPVGSRFATTYSKNQSNVAQFNDVLGATDNIEKTASTLIQKGGKLNSPAVAAAIADPKSTSTQWAQGEFVNSGLTPEERDYVTNVKAYKENLQALRKSAGGGVSDAQVNRLMEMAPGANTPDLDYLKRQTGQIRQTANRLSEGIPSVKGGAQVNKPSGLSKTPTPSGMAVSLAAARSLPQNKGKSGADVRADIESHGHQVVP